MAVEGGGMALGLFRAAFPRRNAAKRDAIKVA
jgi:hypothetical protein